MLGTRRRSTVTTNQQLTAWGIVQDTYPHTAEPEKIATNHRKVYGENEFYYKSSALNDSCVIEHARAIRSFVYLLGIDEGRLEQEVLSSNASNFTRMKFFNETWKRLASSEDNKQKALAIVACFEAAYYRDGSACEQLLQWNEAGVIALESADLCHIIMAKIECYRTSLSALNPRDPHDPNAAAADPSEYALEFAGYQSPIELVGKKKAWEAAHSDQSTFLNVLESSYFSNAVFIDALLAGNEVSEWYQLSDAELNQLFNAWVGLYKASLQEHSDLYRNDLQTLPKVLQYKKLWTALKKQPTMILKSLSDLLYTIDRERFGHSAEKEYRAYLANEEAYEEAMALKDKEENEIFEALSVSAHSKRASNSPEAFLGYFENEAQHSQDYPLNASAKMISEKIKEIISASAEIRYDAYQEDLQAFYGDEKSMDEEDIAWKAADLAAKGLFTETSRALDEAYRKATTGKSVAKEAEVLAAAVEKSAKDKEFIVFPRRGAEARVLSGLDNKAAAAVLVDLEKANEALTEAKRGLENPGKPSMLQSKEGVLKKLRDKVDKAQNNVDVYSTRAETYELQNRTHEAFAASVQAQIDESTGLFSRLSTYAHAVDEQLRAIVENTDTLTAERRENSINLSKHEASLKAMQVHIEKLHTLEMMANKLLGKAQEYQTKAETEIDQEKKILDMASLRASHELRQKVYNWLTSAYGVEIGAEVSLIDAILSEAQEVSSREGLEVMDIQAETSLSDKNNKKSLARIYHYAQDLQGFIGEQKEEINIQQKHEDKYIKLALQRDEALGTLVNHDPLIKSIHDPFKALAEDFLLYKRPSQAWVETIADRLEEDLRVFLNQSFARTIGKKLRQAAPLPLFSNNPEYEALFFLGLQFSGNKVAFSKEAFLQNIPKLYDENGRLVKVTWEKRLQFYSCDKLRVCSKVNEKKLKDLYDQYRVKGYTSPLAEALNAPLLKLALTIETLLPEVKTNGDVKAWFAEADDISERLRKIIVSAEPSYLIDLLKFARMGLGDVDALQELSCEEEDKNPLFSMANRLGVEVAEVPESIIHDLDNLKAKVVNSTSISMIYAVYVWLKDTIGGKDEHIDGFLRNLETTISQQLSLLGTGKTISDLAEEHEHKEKAKLQRQATFRRQSSSGALPPFHSVNKSPSPPAVTEEEKKKEAEHVKVTPPKPPAPKFVPPAPPAFTDAVVTEKEQEELVVPKVEEPVKVTPPKPPAPPKSAEHATTEVTVTEEKKEEAEPAKVTPIKPSVPPPPPKSAPPAPPVRPAPPQSQPVVPGSFVPPPPKSAPPVPPPAPPTSIPAEVESTDPLVQKALNLRKMGMPEAAIEHFCKKNGLDYDQLDKPGYAPSVAIDMPLAPPVPPVSNEMLVAEEEKKAEVPFVSVVAPPAPPSTHLGSSSSTLFGSGSVLDAIKNGGFRLKKISESADEVAAVNQMKRDAAKRTSLGVFGSSAVTAILERRKFVVESDSESDSEKAAWNDPAPR